MKRRTFLQGALTLSITPRGGLADGRALFVGAGGLGAAAVRALGARASSLELD